MNVILVKTKHPRDRYRLISGPMGSAVTAANHANNRFQIVEGIDRGNGYQGYMSISYFLTLTYVPQSAKNMVIDICKKHGLVYA